MKQPLKCRACTVSCSYALIFQFQKFFVSNIIGNRRWWLYLIALKLNSSSRRRVALNSYFCIPMYQRNTKETCEKNKNVNITAICVVCRDLGFQEPHVKVKGQSHGVKIWHRHWATVTRSCFSIKKKQNWKVRHITCYQQAVTEFGFTISDSSFEMQIRVDTAAISYLFKTGRYLESYLHSTAFEMQFSLWRWCHRWRHV